MRRVYRGIGRHCLLALAKHYWWFVMLFACPVWAEESPEKGEKDAVVDGILSSFSLPFEDLFKKKHESEWLNLWDEFSGNIGIDIPLRKTKPYNGLNSQGQQGRYSVTFPISLRYNPLSYWFANVNALLYLDKKLQAPWDSDFTYRFGYDDWHPYTLSLVYANYDGNRFHPNRALGERHTRFLEGTYRLGWKFPLTQMLAEPLLIDPNKTINCQMGFNLTPRYVDFVTESRLPHKQTVTMGCHYPIIEDWLFNFTLFWYPQADQQQPWDPDYTYNLTFSSSLPGNLALQYSNYSGNRYPWRDQRDAADVKDGSIGLSWSLAW
ncbi:hypothetical protein [Beggiatoa leptomitoformis]|uniref:Uncharacterized protein n=1 Tax=Beggiatoa leptomitoformis TaxID=288004 RepID=A0A2N9YDS0_9GAMM|nr:hypothetical protein [Beggiatoa leptomitoformis]AUI68638.1 hypothetical protein BLE401_07915 [Beggiatoa leptomitoformis]QGX03821.1 hypothetical protein AL038_16330 [Beggiatoa leptomitoformis]